MSDYQALDSCALFDFFESRIEEMSESGRKSYKKALNSFRFFISGYEKLPEAKKIPGEWVVAMYAAGLSPKSRLHYFEAMAALYASAVKAGLVADADIFSSLKPAVKAIASRPEAEIEIAALENMRRLTRGFFAPGQGRDPIRGLILLSMLNGAQSPLQLAQLRTDELDRMDAQSREVAMTMVSPGRKYVVPLQQSQLTPRRLERTVAANIGRALAGESIRLQAGMHDTLGAYWALGAISCGARGAEVVAALGFVPTAVPVLSLVDPDASAGDKADLRRAVGSMFLANPKEWFALRLRPHIRYERLESRLNCLKDTRRPEIFYPCHEISRRVNKKIVTEQKPVIPEIVFFRSRVTDVAPLIREVGDLGWVYSNEGTYARIASRAMEAFQQAIGNFAPNDEVGAIGTLKFRPGDRVEILGGMGRGFNGEVLEGIKVDAGVIYRLRIFGDRRDIEFRVADSRMLQKIDK